MEELKILEESELREGFVELIRRVSSNLPDDVIAALKKHHLNEAPNSKAANVLDTIFINEGMAQKNSRPICQDTGTVSFDISYPFAVRESTIAKVIEEAIVLATKQHYLRPNVVDTLTGKSKPDNLGKGHPLLHFHQKDSGDFEVTAILKGGGCENVGAQYSLPNTPLGAGRDLNGVKKVVLDAVVKAAGRGCAPGILGIGIGGDRATSYLKSKEVLKQKLDTVNPNEELAELEEWVVNSANQLGIGPMGYGGNTTLIGAKAGVVDRIPASYFVAVTYMCWAYRRTTMIIKDGVISYD